MSNDSLDIHLPLLKALANASRLSLIALIAKEEKSVGALANELELTEPTVSHHLAKLSAVGLAEKRVSGNTHYYRLNAKALQAINMSLISHASEGQKPSATASDEYEARVLRSFVVEGRVTKVPEGYRKRMVVLRWLAGHFQDRRFYKEREVNEIIKRFHPDFATIRREFIGHGLMERESGTYWKSK